MKPDKIAACRILVNAFFPSGIDKHPFEKIISTDRIVQPSIVDYRDQRKRHGKALANSPLPFLTEALSESDILVSINQQLGDLVLKIKPQRLSFDRSLNLFMSQLLKREERSLPLFVVTRWIELSCLTRCMLSLGTPRPHSVSGQTGISSKKLTRVSVV